MAANNSVIFVEDDLNLGLVVKDFLESEGFEVEHITDGEEAWKALDDRDFTLALIDVMLPGRDGFELLRKIKKNYPGRPVILLTAKSMPEDRLQGFEGGADDYITKPFLTRELLLRMHKVIQNATDNQQYSPRKHLRIGRYRFYPSQGVLYFDSDETVLSSVEAELLLLLVNKRNEMVTREMAFAKVWKNKLDTSSRILDVYVGKLRKILSHDPRIAIRSIHGRGYRLEVH